MPDLETNFGTARRRPVRCSPQLAAFIIGQIGYVKPLVCTDPEGALRQHFRSCFLRDNMMFENACLPYKLLRRSHMIVDMAFVRAVLTASRWLGFILMPAGYFESWPPPGPAAGQ